MSRMAEYWTIAAADLGLEIIAPFRLTPPDGSDLEFDLLLKNFGRPNGTLLTNDFAIPGETIIAQGYAYSIMGQPLESEVYDREGIIEVLGDWQWSGPESSKPDWLPDPPTDDE